MRMNILKQSIYGEDQIKRQEDWIQQVGYRLFSFFYIISSMAEQQNAIPGDIKEVALQADLLKNCLKKFPDLEGKVKNAQLASIQLKYQYFLRKFQKYNEEHQKYKAMYHSIEKTVDESAQIKEQNRSIEFIKKIMEDTEKKYNKLRQNIEQLKIQKESTLNELTSLTSNLKQLKNQFFQLKRKEEEGQNRLKEEELQVKTKQNFKHMFKIRHEKKLTQVLAKKIKPIECSQLLGQPSEVGRKVWDQFEKVNNLKEDFLRQIGINHQEFYKLNEKELNEQSKINKLITKKTFPHIRNHLLKHDSVSETEPLEVFKIVNEYDKEFQEFMRLPTRDLIKLIIKQNKVGEVLQMMEQQKRTAIAAYQTFKSSKSKFL